MTTGFSRYIPEQALAPAASAAGRQAARTGFSRFLPDWTTLLPQPISLPIGVATGKVNLMDQLEDWATLARMYGLGVGAATPYMPQTGLPARVFNIAQDVLAPESGPLPMQPPSGDPIQYKRAFDAFLEATRQGDEGVWATMDDAVTAAQEELDAGKYYWGAAETAGAFGPTGAPFAGGKFLASAAKPAGQAFTKLPGMSKRSDIVEQPLKFIAEVAKKPWEIENWLGAQVIRPISAAARGFAGLVGRGKPSGPVEEILPTGTMGPDNTWVLDKELSTTIDKTPQARTRFMKDKAIRSSIKQEPSDITAALNRYREYLGGSRGREPRPGEWTPYDSSRRRQDVGIHKSEPTPLDADIPEEELISQERLQLSNKIHTAKQIDAFARQIKKIDKKADPELARAGLETPTIFRESADWEAKAKVQQWSDMVIRSTAAVEVRWLPVGRTKRKEWQLVFKDKANDQIRIPDEGNVEITKTSMRFGNDHKRAINTAESFNKVVRIYNKLGVQTADRTTASVKALVSRDNILYANLVRSTTEAEFALGSWYIQFPNGVTKSIAQFLAEHANTNVRKAAILKSGNLKSDKRALADAWKHLSEEDKFMFYRSLPGIIDESFTIGPTRTDALRYLGHNIERSGLRVHSTKTTPWAEELAAWTDEVDLDVMIREEWVLQSPPRLKMIDKQGNIFRGLEVDDQTQRELQKWLAAMDHPFPVAKKFTDMSQVAKETGYDATPILDHKDKHEAYQQALRRLSHKLDKERDMPAEELEVATNWFEQVIRNNVIAVGLRKSLIKIIRELEISNVATGRSQLVKDLYTNSEIERALSRPELYPEFTGTGNYGMIYQQYMLEQSASKYPIVEFQKALRERDGILSELDYGINNVFSRLENEIASTPNLQLVPAEIRDALLQIKQPKWAFPAPISRAPRVILGEMEKVPPTKKVTKEVVKDEPDEVPEIINHETLEYVDIKRVKSEITETAKTVAARNKGVSAYVNRIVQEVNKLGAEKGVMTEPIEDSAMRKKMYQILGAKKKAKEIVSWDKAPNNRVQIIGKKGKNKTPAEKQGTMDNSKQEQAQTQALVLYRSGEIDSVIDAGKDLGMTKALVKHPFLWKSDVPDHISGDILSGLSANPKKTIADRTLNFMLSLLNRSGLITGKYATDNPSSRISQVFKQINPIIRRHNEIGTSIRSYIDEGEARLFNLEQLPPGSPKDIQRRIMDPDLSYENTKIRLSVDDEFNKQNTGSWINEHPTLIDIIARLGKYKPYLRNDQLQFIESLDAVVNKGTVWNKSERISPGYLSLFRELEGLESLPTRMDITQGGGWYLPKGKVVSGLKDGWEETAEVMAETRQRSRRSGTDDLSSEKHSIYPSQGAAIANGIQYHSTGKALELHIKEHISRVTGIEAVDTLMKSGMEGMMDITKAGYKKYLKDHGITEGPGSYKLLSEILEKDFLQKAGTNQVYVTNPIAAAIGREFNKLDPVEVAKFSQKSFWGKVGTSLNHVNQTYRGIKANLDFSALGIHGAILAFRDPANWGFASKFMFRAFASPDAAAYIQRAGINEFNTIARKAGMPVVTDYQQKGLHIAGQLNTDYGVQWIGRLAQSESQLLGLPRVGAKVFERFNLIFGAFGDILRLHYAQSLVKTEMAKGKTIGQIFNPPKIGEKALIEDITSVANKMTGWSEKRFLGDIGDALFFAPRFFQARMETFATALSGTAKLPARPFMKSAGRTLQEREAMRSVMQMFGIGFMLTEMINQASGHETDWRPWLDGRPNSNFGVIRLGGQDFSVFGPTIGFFRAVADTVTGHPERAMRSLGSGISRILWDNAWSGYTLMGDEALITRTPTGDRTLADPESILMYMVDMTVPIAPQATAGQMYEAAKNIPGAIEQIQGRRPEGEALPGPSPLERVVGGVVAAGAETIGGRVSPMSRRDWQNEISREEYGKPYMELDALVRQTVDSIVDKQYGGRSYGGPKGHLYKRRDEVNDSFMRSLDLISQKHLSSPKYTARYNPEEARHKFQKERLERSTLLYGEWRPEKQRHVGGIYEDLYTRDDDKDKPMPQKGTKEYNIRKYYKLFEDATNPIDGAIDWNEYEKLEAQFMGSLSSEEIEQLLNNIRVTEGKYPEYIERMLYAGRYAANVKVDIEGIVGTYYDLEMHPILIRHISLSTGTSPEAIIDYLSKSYVQRKTLEYEEPGRTIAEAFDKAKRENGVLWILKDEFIRRSPDAWLIAMLDAGYNYTGSNKINKNIRGQIRDGRYVPEYNYKQLYEQDLMKEAA